MIAWGPFTDEIHEFDLCTGDVFRVSSRPFLVTGPGDDGLLSVVDECGRVRSVDECGRVRSVDECEAGWRARGVVPDMVRHVGAWRFES